MNVGELPNNTKYIPSEIYVGRLENKIIWHNFVNKESFEILHVPLLRRQAIVSCSRYGRKIWVARNSKFIASWKWL
jgi:hypothetical protein